MVVWSVLSRGSTTLIMKAGAKTEIQIYSLLIRGKAVLVNFITFWCPDILLLTPGLVFPTIIVIYANLMFIFSANQGTRTIYLIIP